MTNQAGYDQYQKNKVLTASPAELTLMLYEGAIKFTNIGIIGIEQNNIEKTHINVMKAQRIIEELKATLNHKYPVASEFDKVYDYILKKLIEGNMKKSKEPLEESLVHMRVMRDTWKEVMRLNKSSQK